MEVRLQDTVTCSDDQLHRLIVIFTHVAQARVGEENFQYKLKQKKASFTPYVTRTDSIAATRYSIHIFFLFFKCVVVCGGGGVCVVIHLFW